MLSSIIEGFLVSYLYEKLKLENDDQKKRLVNALKKAAEQTARLYQRKEGIEVLSKDILRAIQVDREEDLIDLQGSFSKENVVETFISISQFYLPDQKEKRKYAEDIFERFAKITLQEIIKDEILFRFLSYYELKNLREAVPKALKKFSKDLHEIKAEIGIEDTPKRLPEKKSYSKPEEYIERTITQADPNEDRIFFRNNKLDLSEEVISQKRIVLLADAGAGKSIELQRVAAIYSSKETSFYPVFINLENYTNKDISDYLGRHSIIPDQNLILLLDGLDEIQAQRRIEFNKKLLDFCDRKSQVKIVVSCRTNLYEKGDENISGELENFEVYYLEELTQEQIKDYLTSNLTTDEIKKLQEKEIFQLLDNPFYLTNLVNIYDETASIPETRNSFFQNLIQSRINKDIKKIRRLAPEKTINETKELLWNLNKRLAIVLEILGRNECSEQELKQLFEKSEIEVLKKFSSIVKEKKDKSVIWKFEHRQLQEYLASTVLADQSLNELKKVVTFSNNHKKIIPSWYNTFGLLLSSIEADDLKFEELIKWTKSNNEKVFLYLEKDKLSPSLSSKILEKFILLARSRGVGINLRHKEFWSLSKLVDNFRSVDLILETLEDLDESGNKYLFSELIIILPSATIIGKERKTKIKKIYLDSLFSPSTSGLTKSRILYNISKFRFINTASLTKRIIDEFEDVEENQIRTAFYAHLANCSYLDDFIDFLIKALKKNYQLETSRMRGNYEVSYGANRQMRKAILSIRDIESFVKVIEVFVDNPHYIDRQISDFTDSFIDFAVNFYSSDQKIVFDSMVNLYIASVKNYMLDHGKDLVPFFKKTKTLNKAFKKLLPHCINNDEIYVWNLTPFYNSFEESFVEMYRNKKIPRAIAAKFINHLNSDDNVESLIEKLNKFSSEKFEKSKRIDWKAVRKKEKKRDIKLLFDKEKYLGEIEKLFQDYEVVTKDVLSDLRYNLQKENEYANIILDDLIDIIRGEDDIRDLERDEAIRIIKGRNWDEYLPLKYFYRYINGISSREQGQKEIKFLNEEKIIALRNWCVKEMNKINYEKALNTKENGLSRVSYKDLIPWLYFMILEFKLPQDKIEELISFHFYYWTDDVDLSYYEKFLSKDIILTKVFENFERGLEDRYVIKLHLEYAADLNREEVISYALEYFRKKSYDESIRTNALYTLLNFQEGINKIKEVYDEIESEFKWKVLDSLTEVDNDFVVKKLLQTLNEDLEEKEKINASLRLIQLQEIKGLEYYKQLAEEKKGVPHSRYDMKGRGIPISGYKQKEGIDILFDLLELCYHPDFVEKEHLSLNRAVLTSLQNIAIQSDDNFRKIYDRLINFITSNIPKNSQVKNLYFSLDEIQQKYYLNKGQSVTFDEAIGRADTLIASTSP